MWTYHYFVVSYYSLRRVNKGNYIKLEKLNKPVKVSLVKPYEFRKGFCVV
jgi:hypothetical protein